VFGNDRVTCHTGAYVNPVTTLMLRGEVGLIMGIYFMS